METPAEEWARALAELEPLRLEFEVIGADALWRYARAISAIVLVTALALTIPALREREPLLLLSMLLITALLACIPGWYVPRALRLGPESDELDGTRMIIRCRLGSREHVSASPSMTRRFVSVSACGCSRMYALTMLPGLRSTSSRGGIRWCPVASVCSRQGARRRCGVSQVRSMLGGK